jgi:mono/diheme cytochrome c family protein
MLRTVKTRTVIIRLGLGVAAAGLLGALIWLATTGEERRMTATAASFAGRAVENGAATYAAACAGCHGVAGQGVPDVAPALNNPKFFTERLAEIKYPGDLRSFIEATVSSGRPVKNDQYSSVMPAWDRAYGGALRKDEIRDVASFILNWRAASTVEAGAAPASIPADGAAVSAGKAAAAGKAFFGSNACLGCHGWPGRGGITGPDLAGIATRGSKQMPGLDAEAYIRVSILAPSAFIAANCPTGPTCPDMMPRTFGAELSPQEIEQLVRYLLTLTDEPDVARRAGAPPPLVGGLATPEPASAAPATALERGQVVYEAHCGMCHGDRGQGGMGTGLTAVLVSVDPLRYARAATAQGVPGSMMPAWDEAAGGPLSAAELDDVAAYVVDLVRP